MKGQPLRIARRLIVVAHSVIAPAVAVLIAFGGQSAAQSGDISFEPATNFRDCAVCPEMVVVPAGSYVMGSPRAETSRSEDEGPRHDVEISYAFAVSKYEITIDQFSQFVKSNPDWAPGACRAWEGGEWASKWIERADRDWRNPGYGVTSDHPVVCIDWSDATSYADWLSEMAGVSYRLLSEAEWEYAARGGTESQFYFGNRFQDICRFGNVADRSMQARWAATGCDDGFGETTSAAGSFLPNNFGLFDMHGNVWEWVADCWTASYAGAPTDGSARTNGNCDRRVSRGGAWDTVRSSARSANRRWNETTYKISNTGFRIARNASAP
jgi:formylglycine-generating enzyme required for sulfatase activity